MKHYTNIEINVSDNIEIVVDNEGILKYLKEVLQSNFNFKYIEKKLGTKTVLSISENDVSYEVFKRHFEVINDSHLEEHRT